MRPAAMTDRPHRWRRRRPAGSWFASSFGLRGRTNRGAAVRRARRPDCCATPTRNCGFSSVWNLAGAQSRFRRCRIVRPCVHSFTARTSALTGVPRTEGEGLGGSLRVHATQYGPSKRWKTSRLHPEFFCRKTSNIVCTNFTFCFWGTSTRRLPTGGLLLDPAGGLPSPDPLARPNLENSPCEPPPRRKIWVRLCLC